MAGSVNKVILVGNLGRDPEVRTFQNGGKVCNLRIATSETWKDRNTGERQERTEWHRVVLWAKLAELAQRYLAKGRKVYIEGRIQTRDWEDKDGNKRNTTRIRVSGPNSRLVMLGGRGDGGGGRSSEPSDGPPVDDDGGFEATDDDVPF